VVATGDIQLSPELSEYKLVNLAEATVWTSGTGHALQKWLRSKGYEPEVIERYPNGRPPEPAPHAPPLPLTPASGLIAKTPEGKP